MLTIRQDSSIERCIKNAIKKIPFFASMSERKWQPVQFELNRLAERSEPLFFIQIGSNDGKEGDPIYEFVTSRLCSGIVIEPTKELFSKLSKHYAAYPDVLCKNVAIAEESGEKKFYRLLDPKGELPWWHDQIGSLDEATFRKEVEVLRSKEGIENIDDYIVIDSVPCLSFTDLLKDQEVQAVDLLHIDTEGYDSVIIKQIPFETITPRVILFEHSHLSESERASTYALLMRQGYSLRDASCRDTIAVFSN